MALALVQEGKQSKETLNAVRGLKKGICICKEMAHHEALAVNSIFVPRRKVAAKHGLVKRHEDSTGADMQISVGKHLLGGIEKH